ncbi:MAG: flagellar assembly protein T N-terminal domain-containing protein [Archangium sp.]|nr:flagellar assembly protein T N-terminal domain-containing protein [Archangium sp.]
MRSLPVVLLFVAAVTWAQAPAVVEAVGEAAIVDKNKPLARDRAIEDALRRAVEQTCGTLVSSTTDVRNNQLVSDKILTQAKGYVSKYDVVSEKEDKGVVRVTVKATVGTEKLASDLEAIGVTLSRKGMPRLAVLISEQRIDQSVPAAWWAGKDAKDKPSTGALKVDQRLVENSLIDQWTQAGFSFVDTEVLAGQVKTAGVVSADLNAEQVRQIGNISDADIIIVGTAVALKQRDVAELVGDKANELKQTTCSGTISVRAFNADSGEILAAAEANKNTFHLDALTCGRDALLASAKELGVDLQKKLLAKWAKELGGTSRVRLTVSGLDGLGTLNLLKGLMLETVRGVKGIDQKRFAKGSADLDVRLEGPADQLATALEGKPLKQLVISVKGVTPNTVELELVKKEKSR